MERARKDLNDDMPKAERATPYGETTRKSIPPENPQEDISLPVMNESWLGIPVEEVDPLIFDDTFCVITKKMDRNYIHRFSCSKSLFLMGPLNAIRKYSIYIITHRWFDVLIILTIICNCITLAMVTNQFVAGKKYTLVVPEYAPYIEKVEYGFLAIYTAEVVLKVIAKGFVLNKFSYLRNRWNILDLVVVASSYLSIIKDLTHRSAGMVSVPGGEKVEDNSLDFLRTFRVLRVVKTISILPGLRMMINALVSSLWHLLEVMALIFGCLLIFSLFAAELFQGKLSQKCVLDKGGPADPDRLINPKLETILNPDERDRLWTEWVTDWKNWYRRDFPENEATQCGNNTHTRTCLPGYTCIGLLGESPSGGWTNFDTFFYSMFACFQLITSDYWERIYDLVVSTCGVWSLFYFLIIIFMGSYYLLNLLLAVVTMSFENEAQLQDLGTMNALQRLGLNRVHSTFSFDQLSKLHICRMTHYKKRTKSEMEMLAKKAKNSVDSSRDKKERGHLHLDDAIINLFGMRIALQEADDSTKARRSIPALHSPSISMMNSLPVPLTENANSNVLGVDDGRRSAEESDIDIRSAASSTQMGPTASTQAVQPSLRSRLSTYLTNRLTPIVNHKQFENCITICIILNTIALALEHHGESHLLYEILRFSNHVFMTVFTAECIMKILALQGKYFHSRWNMFDMVVVIISYLDLALSNNRQGGRGLSVIRSMRLLRVFKLAQSWITMKVLLNIVFASFGDLGNLTILLLIVIYIFAVMGMQMVGQQYSPGAFDAVSNPLNTPRWNWKHFVHAFMMVFRVLCGEWIEPLWECLEAQEYYTSHHPKGKGSLPAFEYLKCFTIFLPILIVGNFILFNLFLALLLNSFDTEELNAQREKEMEASGRAANLKNIVGLLMHHEEEDENAGEEEEEEVEATGADVGTVPNAKPADIKRTESLTKHSSTTKTPSKERKTSKRMSVLHMPEPFARKRFKKAVNRVILHNRIEAAERAISLAEHKWKQKQLSNRLFLNNPGENGRTNNLNGAATPVSSEVSEELWEAGNCCPDKVWQSKLCPCRTVVHSKRRNIRGCTVWDKCREWSVIIVGNSIFEYTILVLILASSVTLCFEDIHLDSKPRLKRVLCIVNFVFTGAFVVEMILKWFAIGIYGYFTNFWTLLDAFIVAVSLISLNFDASCTGSALPAQSAGVGAALKAFRTMRALRPVRAISRWHNMKIVVNALLHAIPAIFNVLLVCLLFWLVFSIMGVQFFKGTFYHCVDGQGDTLDPTVVPNKDVCCAKTVSHDYSWVNTISNYDNVLEGYLSLFQIATFEGWMELMAYSVDAVGVDKQPRIDNQIAYYLFYVIFIIFGSFFALQLFIGVIIDNFNMLKKKYEGSILEVLLTPAQRNYYIAMKNLGKMKPRPVIQKPKTKFMAYFYYLALSRKLEIVIFAMIFLNMAVEAFETKDSTVPTLHVLSAFKAFFTIVYILEAIIKILGLGVFYFTVPWNVYDLILVLASVMDIFLASDLTVTFPITPAMLRIVRVIRVGRILRSVKAAQGFRKLLFALTISLPALLNIGALLALITFIYAILGMAMFGRVPEKWSMDNVFSFQTFLSSNLVLFRLMTAAGWNEVLDSLTVVTPVCGEYRHLKCNLPGEPECPMRWVAVAYIISYLFISNQIMINLFIAIILENYVEASDEEDVGIVEDDLGMFYIRWSRYDPHATHFISFDDLSDFLDSLDAPFKVAKPNRMAIVAFNLPIARGNKLHCLDILHALIRHVLGQVEDSPEFRKLQHRMERKFQKQFPTHQFLEIISSTRRWKVEINAAIKLQRAWRRFKARKADKPIQVKPKKAPLPPKPEGTHGGIGHMMNRVGNTSEETVPHDDHHDDHDHNKKKPRRQRPKLK